jgi:hypothetical protein
MKHKQVKVAIAALLSLSSSACLELTSGIRKLDPSDAAIAPGGSPTPNSENYVSGAPTKVSIPMGNRHYVNGLMVENFSQTVVTDITNTGLAGIDLARAASILGGPCDLDVANDCGGEVTSEVPMNLQANTLYAAVIQRSCEIAVSPKYNTDGQGIRRIYTTITGQAPSFAVAPARAQIEAIYKLFYRNVSAAPAAVLDSLEVLRDAAFAQDGASAAEKNRNAWAQVTASICSHPGWLVL